MRMKCSQRKKELPLDMMRKRGEMDVMDDTGGNKGVERECETSSTCLTKVC